MTLLEKTYRQLRSAGLVPCAEAFSRDYLGKNTNWFAYQKHTARDFSVGAAIQCLRSIRCQKRSVAICSQQRDVLNQTEHQLLTLLNEQHGVADVC